MTKSDLIEIVAGRDQSWTRRDAEGAVNAIFGTVADALQRGDRVEIRGLGSFATKMRLPRVGRNPKTGDRVDIPERVSVSRLENTSKAGYSRLWLPRSRGPRLGGHLRCKNAGHALVGQQIWGDS